MSIRFAAAGSGECLSVARTLRRPRLSAPANDSDAAWPQDVLLQSALRHFARHGLGAAERARASAIRAFYAGRHEDYQHWLAVCHHLDRRMATGLTVDGGLQEDGTAQQG
jgi:hypothetical protein